MAHNRGRARRMNMTWLSASLHDATLAVDSSITSLVFTAVEAETILRIRGEVVALLEAPTANDACVFGWGFRVAANGTAAAGSTISPFTDGGADWIALGYHPLQATGSADLAEGIRQVIDSKAMRKIKAGEELIFVAENNTAVGVGTLELTFAARVLVGQ